MKNLMDESYFKDEIDLPGAILEGDNENISGYINQYEKEVLMELLGYDLYKALKAQIDSGTYTAPWKDFIEGAEYEVDSGGDTHTVKWNGLVNAEKVSLISYYIYFNYMRDLATKTTQTGETISANENSNMISPSDKMSNAWNRHLELYGSVGDGTLTASAYRYLTEKEDDFPLWVFTEKTSVNSFDI